MRHSKDLEDVLSAAQNAAWERSHNQVAPFHFLYGLMETDNVASIVVRRLNYRKLAVIDILGFIDRALGRGELLGRTSTLPLTENANKALDYAQSKAATVGLAEVGCDHLLLGIYNYDTAAKGLLEHLGVSLKDVKREFRAILAF